MSLLLLCTGVALFALALTAFNLSVWPRGSAAGAPALSRVSILIPARNEARGIEACVRAARATGALEVAVCDDGSADQTPLILRRLAAELPRLRIVTTTTTLTAGWVGKARACALLHEQAAGDSFFFVDADVELAADALERLAGVVDGYGADVVTGCRGSRWVRCSISWCCRSCT